MTATVTPFPARLSSDPSMVVLRNERTDAEVPYKLTDWTDVPSDTGNGSVTLQIANESAIAKGDILTVVVAGEDAFSWKATRRVRRTLAVDPTDRTVVWSGPGLLDELSEWIVSTPNPIGDAPEGAELRYDWTSCDISAWDDATERSLVGDATALPPDGLGGLTADFPNPLAYWLAPRAAVTGADPSGVFYGGFDFTLADDTFYVPYWLADDLVQPALDGVLMDQFVDRGSMASKTRCRLITKLKAGTHRWRFKVENVERPHPENCGLFAFAAAERTLSGLDTVEEWLHTSSVADGFKTLDYGEGAPGFTVGEIINDLFVRAIAEDLLGTWTFTFNTTVDSATNAWPTVQQRFRTGMTLLDCLKQMAAAGLVEFRCLPGQRVLEAFLPSSLPTGPDLDWHELRDLTHDEDPSTIADRILTRDETGRLRWFGDADGVMAFAELGGVDGEAAIEGVAAAELARLAAASWSVSFTHLPVDPADGPYGDTGYRTLTTIGVPNEALDGHDDYMVVSIVGKVDEFGRLQPAVTTSSRRKLLAERQAIAARRSTPGVKSDAVAPVTPLQPAAQVLEPIVLKWSWSGRADAITDLTGPKEPVTRPFRLHTNEGRVSGLAGAPDGNATEVHLLLNGSPIFPGLLEVLWEADDEDDGETGTVGVLLVQPGDVLTPVFDRQGQHLTGSLIYRGAYLPQ